MEAQTEMVPLLVVRGAAHAIDFYVRALGAEVLARYEHGAERRLSHADLALAGARFAVTEEAPRWNSDAPQSLGGSPVVLQLGVADAGAALGSMLDAGATIVFPLQELLGERMARVRDPFGHLWIVRQRLEDLSVEEIQRRRDDLFRAAMARLEDDSKVRGATPSRQARIHLVIGPVGAGKSTFAARLARDHGAVRLTLDQWMATLFTPDRPPERVIEWYVERAARSVEQISAVARDVIAVGTEVVLEIGLLARREREAFYGRVKGCDLTVHVVDAARDVRRQRVEQRNREGGPTFSMVVPPEIFELASDLWEPPQDAERAGRDVRFVRTD